ncbi:hypothetical protein HaLaN_12656 [Haematococcus lacustris]|uniref:Uncharacterized protein n=1 Tax=Haematococcus lacustris TaxID=44745 RepID=A0A699Z3Y2_HAELA|nr:hypothetical protein HaLaN_12656 [Haematococcus lacustris]
MWKRVNVAWGDLITGADWRRLGFIPDGVDRVLSLGALIATFLARCEKLIPKNAMSPPGPRRWLARYPFAPTDCQAVLAPQLGAARMAEPELVNVFQAGTGTVLSPFTATTSCADALDYLTAEYGAGVLKWTSEGRVIPVTKSSFPTLPLTGKLDWHAVATTQAPAHVVAGRPGVGEATLTRNLASQTGEIQVVLHEAEVRSTAHLEEMKQEMKLEMKRELERQMEQQMKRIQAQLLEGAVPNRKQAFVRLGVFFACWIGAFWIELRSPHRFELKMLLDHTPVLVAMVAMFGVLLVPKMKLRATLYRYLSGPLESSMGSAR